MPGSRFCSRPDVIGPAPLSVGVSWGLEHANLLEIEGRARACAACSEGTETSARALLATLLFKHPAHAQKHRGLRSLPVLRHFDGHLGRCLGGPRGRFRLSLAHRSDDDWDDAWLVPVYAHRYSQPASFLQRVYRERIVTAAANQHLEPTRMTCYVNSYTCGRAAQVQR